MPDNGNEWRKFRIVPRSHPLRLLVLLKFDTASLFNRDGNRRAFRLPEEGDDFHCMVEPSPGHIQCRSSTDFFQFSLFWAFCPGGGGLPRFCGQSFYGHLLLVFKAQPGEPFLEI